MLREIPKPTTCLPTSPYLTHYLLVGPMNKIKDASFVTVFWDSNSIFLFYKQMPPSVKGLHVQPSVPRELWGKQNKEELILPGQRQRGESSQRLSGGSKARAAGCGLCAQDRLWVESEPAALAHLLLSGWAVWPRTNHLTSLTPSDNVKRGPTSLVCQKN